GGSMSGGAYKNTSNLLSRRREIKDIEDKIARIDEEIKNIFAKANDLRGERTDLNMDVEDNKDELSDLNLKKNTVTINLKAAMERLDDAKGFYNDISQETKAVIDSENQINTLLNDLNGQLANNNQTSSENEALIKELEQKLENAKNSEKEANEKLMSISKDYSALEQGHNFISENKQRIEDEIKVLQSEVDELSQKLGQSDSQANEKNEEIENKRKEIEDNKKDIESLVVALEEANKVKEEKNSSHKSFFAKREELSDSISRLDKELFRLNAHKEKITEQLESFVNYMWEEYELTYGTALKYNNEETAKDGSLKKKISELKTKIKALGDVNVNAVEDYKNLVERYELLKTQHDDLVESEQALRKIIEQLDDEMRKQFNEKFEQIKEQFDIVFRQLFGGGKANLELTVDEDILEAGIRINAQPPGKKLQNMMQLSGGEKALTAISLLFAIQNLKPSPFCLLDEIEAALDDSNVKRFAQYLHKLTKNTQFIVITHRRGTMSAADILYGITMQEKGVSTLVSVNLIEEQLDK
ncbi:MAG: AAA family ATPase, partial [Lachnospiraceae bacterium]|nr:AAA family ATPase [Lachnospiraceae bacterium]